METYYQVTYKLENGLEVRHTRDTVERGYFLYKSIISDFIEDKDYDYSIKLEEVSKSGITLLRAEGEYKRAEGEEKADENEEEKENTEPPKTLFEMMFGITKDEYNECLTNWCRLTGESVELL